MSKAAIEGSPVELVLTAYRSPAETKSSESLSSHSNSHHVPSEAVTFEYLESILKDAIVTVSYTHLTLPTKA